MDYAVIHFDNTTLAVRRDRDQAEKCFYYWADLYPCHLIVCHGNVETVLATAPIKEVPLSLQPEINFTKENKWHTY